MTVPEHMPGGRDMGNMARCLFLPGGAQKICSESLKEAGETRGGPGCAVAGGAPRAAAGLAQGRAKCHGASRHGDRWNRHLRCDLFVLEVEGRGFVAWAALAGVVDLVCKNLRTTRAVTRHRARGIWRSQLLPKPLAS